MASRKPLVIVDGRIRQIAAGDTLDVSVNEVDVISQVNDNAGALVIGTPVYTSGSGSVDKAQADDVATVEVLGLVRDASIATTVAGNIQTDGVLTATTGQWDAITGQTGGLTVGAVYYLSPTTAGNLTVTAPSAVGHFVARIGKAISETELEITIEQSVEL
jgi:GH18 family chitinase